MILICFFFTYNKINDISRLIYGIVILSGFLMPKSVLILYTILWFQATGKMIVIYKLLWIQGAILNTNNNGL